MKVTMYYKWDKNALERIDEELSGFDRVLAGLIVKDLEDGGVELVYSVKAECSLKTYLKERKKLKNRDIRLGWRD